MVVNIIILNCDAPFKSTAYCLPCNGKAIGCYSNSPLTKFTASSFPRLTILA